VDLEGISTLLTRDGWALLESLPRTTRPWRSAWVTGCAAHGHPAELVRRADPVPAACRGPRQFGRRSRTGCCSPRRPGAGHPAAGGRRHAQRFASAGMDRVADLGCGVGADSMALAGLAREVLAVAAGRRRGHRRRRHRQPAALAGAVVRHEDATATELTGVRAAFVIRPARVVRKAPARSRARVPPASFVLAGGRSPPSE